MSFSQFFRFSIPDHKIWKVLKDILTLYPLLLPDTVQDCFENEDRGKDGKSFTVLKRDGSKYSFDFTEFDEKDRAISWIVSKASNDPAQLIKSAVLPQPCIEHISVVYSSNEPEAEGSCEVYWETQFLDPAFERAAQKYQMDLMQTLGHMMGVGASHQIRPLISPTETMLLDTMPSAIDETQLTVTSALEGSSFQVLDPESNLFGPGSWKELQPGQIVQVSSQQYMPADLILLHGDSVYIQRSKLDGDDKVYARNIASEVLVDLSPKLGSGDPSITKQLSDAGFFEVCSPLTDPDYFHAKFITKSGASTEMKGEESSKTFEVSDKQFLPQLSKLLVAESCVGMVVFTGEETVFAQAGGECGFTLREEITKRQKERSKKKKERDKQKRAALLSTPLDPYKYEEETGISWEDHFTDVLDDGNCMIHALWLGLKTLVQHYPELQLGIDIDIKLMECASAADFRTVVLQKLSQAENYRDSVRNQVGLWLSVDGSVLMALEEFFTMPPEFQTTVMEMNQQVQLMGGAVDDAQVEVVVDQYINSLMLPQEVNGAVYYNPLGEIEMEFLCELLQVRLQVVKSEALELIFMASQKIKMSKGIGHENQTDEKQKPSNAIMLASIDPRTIRPEHLLDRSSSGGLTALKRIVRILNVNTNHYQVHLPKKKA